MLTSYRVHTTGRVGRMRRIVILIGLCVSIFLVATAITYAEDNYTYDGETGTLTIKNDNGLAVAKSKWVVNAIIEEGVTKIPESAFYKKTSLESVNIPSSVTEIGREAFGGCSKLKSVNILSGVTVIDSSAFSSCSSLESVNMPDSVTSIGNQVFYGCSSLESVNISDSVTSIGNLVFYRCSSLKSVSIPDSVTSIGDQVFYGCSSLKSVSIPNSLKSIGSYAFWDCSSLTSVNIPEGIATIADGVFNNCRSLMSIKIPDSVTEIGKAAFQTCRSLSKIELPDGVKSIKDFAFRGCNSLTEINIPSSIKSLGDEVFRSCFSLTTVIAPNGIPSVGKSLFTDCSGLTSVNIEEGVTSIGVSAFLGCKSLKSIKLPDSVTTIADEAFADCASLKSITIPKYVASIGNEAFSGCDALSDIYCDPIEAPDIKSDIFNAIKGDFRIYIKLNSSGYVGYLSNDYWAHYRSHMIMERSLYFETGTVSKVYGDGNFVNAVKGAENVSYTSDNTDIATVDSASGEVTIKGAGNVNIKAVDSDSGAKAEYSLVIAKAPVKIVADNKSMEAGTDLPKMTYTVTGLVCSDKVKTEPQLSVTTDGKEKGTFDIKVSGGQVSNSSNYDITYEKGTLVVESTTPGSSSDSDNPDSGSGSDNPGSSSGSGNTSSGSGSDNPSSGSDNHSSGSGSGSGSETPGSGSGSGSGAGSSSASVNKPEVNLPKSLQEEVIREKIGKTPIKIDKPNISIDMDLAAVTSINKQANADVQLTAKSVDVKSLSKSVQGVIGTRPVYNLEAVYGVGDSKKVRNFGDGTVTVKLPYSLGPGESPKGICAVYADDKETVKYIENSYYDTSTKSVVFTTNHFSVYGVGYKIYFKDISNHWAESAIRDVADRSIMSGTSVDTFSPNAPMTRGMFITTIGRMKGVPTDSKKTKFTDVSANAYYAPYVGWATDNCIVSGTSETTFEPDKPITREQMAVILYKNIGIKSQKSRVYTDEKDIANWAEVAAHSGLLYGRPDGSFDPKGTATRAEVASLLSRME